MSDIPIDLSHMPPPPSFEVAAEHPGYGLALNPNAPPGVQWVQGGYIYATVECCGCSYRFMPHGDVVIVPCKKHKKRMLAIGGRCDKKKQ